MFVGRWRKTHAGWWAGLPKIWYGNLVTADCLSDTNTQNAYFFHKHPNKYIGLATIASIKLSGNTVHHHLQDPLIFLQLCTICGVCGVSQTSNGHQLLVKRFPTWLILLPTIFEGKHPSSCGNLACVWFSALIFMTLSSTCAVYH